MVVLNIYRSVINTKQMPLVGSYYRASGKSGEKNQISRDFQRQIRGKNGRFRGNFVEMFEGSFAEKRLVENG